MGGRVLGYIYTWNVGDGTKDALWLSKELFPLLRGHQVIQKILEFSVLFKTFRSKTRP